MRKVVVCAPPTRNSVRARLVLAWVALSRESGRSPWQAQPCFAVASLQPLVLSKPGTGEQTRSRAAACLLEATHHHLSSPVPSAKPPMKHVDTDLDTKGSGTVRTGGTGRHRPNANWLISDIESS